ncbi:hypothetical protein B1756_00090 [Natrarchaeobaculum aegyptiacum]|uniref:Uncharacterized protein n=1 Tax=Natrarchaeobaculum aegyptiacum TaxID=745377 RepID=A0A2Z2HWK9_9EURY|nr:hypothetical protein B1756_00090 [Natrarchaeobaculum aegyptiacum]
MVIGSATLVGGVGAVGDVPPEEAEGPELLIETNVDNDHACTHDEADNRTALDAGDSPEDAPVVTDDHVIWNVTTDGGEGFVRFDNTEHESYPGLDSWVFYYADADLEPTDGEVLETGDVPECGLDNYANVSTPEDGVFDLQITSDEYEEVDDAAGEINVEDDINADDESFDVTTSDYTELTDGVVLVEDGQDNGETYDSVGDGETLTVDVVDAGFDLNDGEDVTATLYESDSQENELDTDSTTVEEAVGDEIEEFEIVDRSTDEVAAYVHGDHWHDELPHVDEGADVSLGANIEDADGEEIDLSDEEYSLGIELADEAEEDVVTFHEHGDHVHIEGEEEGHTEVVFQLVHDGHVEYETPSIAVEVEHDEDETEFEEVSTFELHQDGETVASIDGGEWDGELPAIEEPPFDDRFVAVTLTATAEDEHGNEIELGSDSPYEVGVEPDDDAAAELLSIDEHGDSVVLDGEGSGTADVTFQIRDADGVEYETPVASVDVDVPPGVKFLVETNVDHGHAATHGLYDGRTALDAGAAPGDGPVLVDDHVIWNVTYDGTAGYVTYDSDGHDIYPGLDSWVFYIADGEAEPVNAEVLERGEVEGVETDTLEEYIKVETPDDGTIDFQVSRDLSANSTTTENEFAGIVADDEPLPVAADGLTDADGATIDDDEATVQLVRDGTVLAQTHGVSIDDGEISDATIDTEAIADDVEPGPATVEIAGVETETEAQVELVHEAHSLENGFTTTSLPQPAALHTESVDTIEWWDTDNQSYVSLGAQYGDGDTIANPDDMHRGLYIGAADDARLGYEFETDSKPAPGDAHLSNGWHLASSNFAVGEDDGTRTLEKDLVNVDPAADGVTVFDYEQRTQLDPSASIAGFDTYWVYVDDPERTDRGIVRPNYDPVDRSDILHGTDE